LSNVIPLSAYRRKPVCPVDEARARMALAAIRSERMAAELEQLERELEAMLRDSPRVSL